MVECRGVLAAVLIDTSHVLDGHRGADAVSGLHPDLLRQLQDPERLTVVVKQAALPSDVDERTAHRSCVTKRPVDLERELVEPPCFERVLQPLVDMTEVAQRAGQIRSQIECLEDPDRRNQTRDLLVGAAELALPVRQVAVGGSQALRVPADVLDAQVPLDQIGPSLRLVCVIGGGCRVGQVVSREAIPTKAHAHLTALFVQCARIPHPPEPLAYVRAKGDNAPCDDRVRLCRSRQAVEHSEEVAGAKRLHGASPGGVEIRSGRTPPVSIDVRPEPLRVDT